MRFTTSTILRVVEVAFERAASDLHQTSDAQFAKRSELRDIRSNNAKP
jgi:hypothetical protein